MISLSDGKISGREYSSLIFLTTGSKLADMTPTILLLDGSTATWMIPLVSAVVISGPLLLLLHLVNHYEVGLVELCFKLTGKFIGTLLGLVIFVILIFATAIDTRNYVETMSTMFFPVTPIVILYVIFMGVSLFIAGRGIQNVSRTAWIVLPYIKIALLLLILLSLSKLNVAQLYPLWGDGAVKILRAGVTQSSLYGEVMILTIFYLNLRKGNKIKKVSFISLCIVIFESSLFFAVYVAYFDIFSVKGVMYPFLQLSRSVQMGSFVTSLEVFYFAFWIAAGFIRFAIYLLAICYIFCEVLQIKRIQPLLITFAVLVILLGLIPDNVVESQIYMKKTLLLPNASLVILGTPLLLGIAHLWRKRRRLL